MLLQNSACLCVAVCSTHSPKLVGNSKNSTTYSCTARLILQHSDLLQARKALVQTVVLIPRTASVSTISPSVLYNVLPARHHQVPRSASAGPTPRPKVYIHQLAHGRHRNSFNTKTSAACRFPLRVYRRPSLPDSTLSMAFAAGRRRRPLMSE